MKTPKPNSQLSATISFSFKELAKSINKYLAPIMYEGVIEADGKAPMSLRVQRDGKIEVRQKDEILLIEADVHVWVKVHGKRSLLDLWKDLPGVSVEETSFNMRVSFYSQVQLRSDWSLHSDTVGNFTWTKKPKLGLGLLNLNISKIVAPTLQDEINKIADQIDAFVLHEIALPERIQNIWETLCTPYELNETWPSHLFLLDQHSALVSSPLIWNKEKLSLQIASPHTSSVFIQKNPPYTQINRIPSFQAIESTINKPTTFNIYIHPSDVISYLENQEIEIGDNYIFSIQKTSIQRIDQVWTVTLQATVQVSRRFFKRKFQVELTIHTQTNKGNHSQWVVLNQLSYQMKTQHYFVRLWEKYNHSSLNTQLETSLNQWLKDIQGTILSEIDSFLAGTHIHTHAYLSGSHNTIKIDDLMYEEDYLVLVLRTDPNINIELLDF